MAKICKNCACYEVCFMANPHRAEDCNIAWSPIVVLCKDCKGMNEDKFCIAWKGFVREDDFCSYGERKDND